MLRLPIKARIAKPKAPFLHGYGVYLRTKCRANVLSIGLPIGYAHFEACYPGYST